VPDRFDLGFHLDPGMWAALAVTLAVCAVFVRAFWNLLVIPKIRPRPGDPAPDCMVVIPARDEEATIARAVESLPHDSVIVVDDHSKDGTAEAARKAGAGVVAAPDLERGAVGKANACLAGARVLQSRWILFTDADTWFETGFLQAAVATAAARELVFLSIHLWPTGETFSERMLAPLAAAFTYAGMRPRTDGVGAFLGQCILARRDGYEFLGGHAAVLNAFAEDVKLATIARRHRLDFGVARAGSLAHAHFRQPSETLLRAGYRLMLLDRSAWLAVTSGAAMMALWPPAIVWVALNGNYKSAAAFLLAPLVIAIIWSRSAFALLLPLAVYVAAARLWTGLAVALSGRKIRWKGRSI
jgi:glycosyltransferase involved in cell wall biosynthesis